LTRLGWILLLIFGVAAVAFGLMLTGSEIPDAEPSEVGSAAGRPDAVVGSLVIPVAGVKPDVLTDSWGDSRGGGTREHKAIDIMAPRGTPVVAAAPGIVEKLFDSANGGRTIYVRSNDGRMVYYYAHLDSYRVGLSEGQRVRTGDVIGTVGSTGSAGDGEPHLHFEIKRMSPGEAWHQGSEINPYPLLAGQAADR